ncbi:MAG: hypothetical protein H6706_05500 [Myxococcales bacterium]|nr:hypothetical protein [Myxococcales bacterium]
MSTEPSDGVLPISAFYERQLGSVRLGRVATSHGWFIWAPPGQGVHQAVVEHIEHHADGLRLRVLRPGDPDRMATTALEADDVLWVVVQVERDFNRLIMRPDALGQALRRGHAIVTSEVPPKLMVDDRTSHRALDKAIWSGFWTSGLWQHERLDPWRADNRERVTRWCQQQATTRLRMPATAAALDPPEVGGHPTVLRAAWGRLPPLEAPFRADELPAEVIRLALASEELRRLRQPVADLLAADVADEVLPLLRRVCDLPAPELAAVAAEELGLVRAADLLRDVGLVRDLPSGGLALACPLLLAHLRVALTTAAPASRPPDRVAPPAVEVPAVITVAAESDRRGTLHFGTELAVPLSGRKQLKLAQRAAAAAQGVTPPVAIEQLIGFVGPTHKAVEMQVERLRGAIERAGGARDQLERQHSTLILRMPSREGDPPTP